MNGQNKQGFTLVEMLVVIAIIGILISMLLPGVQAVREVARRSNCSHHLSQLILAVHHYEMSQGMYPPGSIDTGRPIVNAPKGLHHNWIIHLLPELDEPNAWRQIDRSVSVYDPKHAALRQLTLEPLVCPSSPRARGVSNYAGVHHDTEAPIDIDNNGVFFLNSALTVQDIQDGKGYTIFIGEKLPEVNDLGWMSGTRATLRNTGWPLNAGRGKAAKPLPAAALPVGGFQSEHYSVCNFAMGDGSIHPIATTVDQRVLQLLGNRADGKALSSTDY